MVKRVKALFSSLFSYCWVSELEQPSLKTNKLKTLSVVEAWEFCFFEEEPGSTCVFTSKFCHRLFINSEDTEVRKNNFPSGSKTELEHYKAKFQLMCTPIQTPPLEKTLQVILLRHGLSLCFLHS